jgi:hypothetical protein
MFISNESLKPDIDNGDFLGRIPFYRSATRLIAVIRGRAIASAAIVLASSQAPSSSRFLASLGENFSGRST